MHLVLSLELFKVLNLSLFGLMVTHVCQFGLNGQIRNYVFKSAKKVFGNITNELLA